MSHRHFDGFALFFAQFIRANLIGFGQFTTRKSIEELSQFGRIDLEPFRAWLALDLVFYEIGVEVVVGKANARSIFENGVVFQYQVPTNVGRLRLLINALFDRLPFGIADFNPSVVMRNAWGFIGIDHRDDSLKALNLNCHYTISFTCVSMNSISLSARPYFSYNWRSISAIDCDQSMSDCDVKS